MLQLRMVETAEAAVARLGLGRMTMARGTWLQSEDQTIVEIVDTETGHLDHLCSIAGGDGARLAL